MCVGLSIILYGIIVCVGLYDRVQFCMYVGLCMCLGLCMCVGLSIIM
jgi:hypothetical protein